MLARLPDLRLSTSAMAVLTAAADAAFTAS
jgi:hypothetical protein